MPFTLSQRSLDNLKGVHPDLVKVVKRAIQITEVDFVVIEGLRTVQRQRELVAKGASTTMNSRHLDGHAFDAVPFVNGAISWDWPLYFKLAKAFKQAAKELGVSIEWGGDWKKFKDGPHWQLPFNKYPKGSYAPSFVNLPPEVENDKPYTLETEQQAATKAVASTAGGVAVSSSFALDPVMRAVDSLTQQQSELTSGDVVKIGVAAVIIILTVWYSWKKIR